MRRSWVVVPLLLALGAAVAGCDGGDAEPGPARPSSSSAPVKKAHLTLGVWGGDNEIEAYQGVVDTYNAYNDEATVRIKSYPTHEDLMAALSSGKAPDVFLTDRDDLSALETNDLNQPIGGLLDDRGVDFGDGYSRPALEAFSQDRQLQCMPYGISPMVMYYNPALVDFQAMADKGIDVPAIDYQDLTEADVDLRAVPGGRGVRQPAAPRDRGLLHRADDAWAGSVHLLGRRVGLQRRRHADLAGVLLRRHEVRPRAGASGAGRPEAHRCRPSSWPRRRPWSGSGRESSA